MQMSRYAVAAAAITTAAALAATGCSKKQTPSTTSSSGGSGAIVSKAKAGTLVVGVKYDQPALGLKGPSGVEGFDVDVAKYIAKKLGAPDGKVTFKEAR